MSTKNYREAQSSRMKFFPRKLSGRLSPKCIKKPILGTLKTGSKLVGAGILMGAGAEIAGQLSSRAQGVEDGSQYIMLEDFGPSLARFDSIEAATDGPQK